MKSNLWLILVLVFAAIVATYIVSSSSDKYCDIKPIRPRSIISSTIPVRDLWAVKIGIAPWKQIVSTPELLITANCRDVSGFNMASGKLLWHLQQNSMINSVGYLTYDHRSHQVYGQVDPWGLFSISPVDGKVLWVNQDNRFAKRFTKTYLVGSDQVIAQIDNSGWYLDTATGKLLDQLATTANVPVLYLDSVVITASSDSLEAIDSTSGALIWATQLGSTGGLGSITVIDYMLLFKLGSKFLAVDKRTGNLIWSYISSTIVSNPVVNNSIVYVLDDNGTVLMLRVTDGVVVGNIQFEPPNSAANLANSWISAWDGIVAVYFQDTQSLSVIKH
jgi:outer membrane protein assembly factor BamB